VQAVISQSPGGMESRSLLVPYPAAPSQSDQHALYRDMESRWAVNPKVRRGDHTFLMVSDFLTNPGFPADSCSVWVASGRMHVDIIVSHRWITEFTGNGSNGEMVCFRAARNKVDCRWETMFSPLEVQNALGV